MPLTATQITALTTAIRETAREEILPRFRNLDSADIDSKAHAGDLVTVADRAAERVMTERFQAILPGDQVIGEEAISEGTASLKRLASGRCVVIDPIDGTWNYAHGLATFGVLVAVVEDGETVWGCLYDPSHDDWISATKGGGTWFHRNGSEQRLQTDQTAVPFNKIRGNLGETFMSQKRREGLCQLIPQMYRHAPIGPSVWEYRMLCSGGSDFVVNRHLNVWDHAAGALCLAEAGGVNRTLDGQPYDPAMTTPDADSTAYLLNARSEAVWEMVAEKVLHAFGEHQDSLR